jgi:glycosidase
VQRSARGLAAAALVAVGLATLAGAALGASRAAPPPPSGAQLAVLAQPPRVSAFATQRVYFVMTDRYRNGDASNDRGGRSGSASQTGFDPADVGFFHGGDFAGLTGTCDDPSTGLARIKELGFTALWVTPPVGQKTVQADSAAYHGYWGLDFTGVDRHLGSEADFKAFVDCAHRLGLKVYVDVVVNHTADVISPSGQGYVGPEDVPYRDCKGKPFVAARYAGGTTFPCLAEKYMPRIPILLPGDRKAKSPSWLNNTLRYHNRGDIDFAGCNVVCYEQGDFYGLDDLFTEQPAVVQGLADAHGSWITRFGVDGFRVDTAKHVDARFFPSWVPKIRAKAKAAGVQDFEIFGEVFVSDAIELSRYPRDRGVPNLLDFPLQDALVRYAGGSAGAKGIQARLDDDDYFLTPSGTMPTPGTFLGNHDIGRVGRLIKDQSGASGSELLRRVNLAHSLLYLLRGAPVVYYGDEVGMMGTGGDKAARQDMFSTKVRSWQVEERVGSAPIGTRSSFDVADHPVAAHLRLLGALRSANPGLATGGSAVRTASQGVLVVSRFDPAGRELLTAFNAGKTAARVTVRTATPSTAWTELVAGAAPVTSGATGSVALTIPPLTALLYRPEAALPARAPGAVAVKVGADALSSLWKVSVTVGGGAPGSVAVAVRRARGTVWTRVGTDASPPYRVFLDPRRYRRGEVLYVVAVARSLDGSTAISPVVTTTMPRSRG